MDEMTKEAQQIFTAQPFWWLQLCVLDIMVQDNMFKPNWDHPYSCNLQFISALHYLLPTLRSRTSCKHNMKSIRQTEDYLHIQQTRSSVPLPYSTVTLCRTKTMSWKMLKQSSRSSPFPFTCNHLSVLTFALHCFEGSICNLNMQQCCCCPEAAPVMDGISRTPPAYL